ncbi:MAG: hypothetical protein KIT09_25025 [Bryobacteraceae bacterium]|nr:hypothetical protein [Bryobacteraceae bacterium]
MLEGVERGHSAFDVRHAFSVTGSYELPRRNSLAGALFGDWRVEWVGTARAGLPFDVLGISSEVSDLAEDGNLGLYALVRPNYTGEPLWIADSDVAGKRRLNPAAFTTPEAFAQGNLGRNVLRGLGLWQVDVSLRRQIAASEQARLQVMAQAFNILNHANFANPSPLEQANLASPSFGAATRALGGLRALQLGLRVEF